MSTLKFSAVILFVALIIPISASAKNRTPSDTSNESQNTISKLAEGAQSSRETTTKKILEKIYSLFFPGKDRIKPFVPTSSQPSPSIVPAVPTDHESDSNLLPTSVYPSITYFPQTDPNNILNNTGLNYPSSITSNVQKCLQNRGIYQAASAQTGVPWQVLAGIHYTEGSCDPNKSLVSGRQLGVNEPDLNGNCSSQYAGVGKPKALPGGGCGFDNLLDTAVYAGNHLKGKNQIGQSDGIPRTHEELVYSLAGYNGWGNTNCGKTPYQFCPPLFKGEDHTYVFNKNPDSRHETMYIVYCADRKTCRELGREPPVHQQYGVLTVAGAVSSLAL